jgi:hypothetical protein
LRNGKGEKRRIEGSSNMYQLMRDGGGGVARARGLLGRAHAAHALHAQRGALLQLRGVVELALGDAAQEARGRLARLRHHAWPRACMRARVSPDP